MEIHFALFARCIDTRRPLLKDATARNFVPGEIGKGGRELDSPAETHYGSGCDCLIQNNVRGRMDAWEQLRDARCTCRFRYCGVNSTSDLVHGTPAFSILL